MLTFIIIAAIIVLPAVSGTVFFIHKKYFGPDSDKEHIRQHTEFKSDIVSEKALPLTHEAVELPARQINKADVNEPPKPLHVPEPPRPPEPYSSVGDMCRQCRIRHYEQMLKEYSLHRREDD
ncbi:MAG: hypothetical protein ACI4TH_03020 [Candidatus Ornithomonoglobus sp.]